MPIALALTSKLTAHVFPIFKKGAQWFTYLTTAVYILCANGATQF